MTAELKYDAPFPPEINKYKAILSRDPGSMVFAPLVEIYRKAGMLDEAIATAQDGLKIHPNYVSGMVVLGRAYAEKGMLAEAKETLDKVLVLAPDNIIAANVLQEIKQKLADRASGNTVVPKPGPLPTSAPTGGPAQSLSPEGEGAWPGLEEDLDVIEAVELEEVTEVEEAEVADAGIGEVAEQAYGEEITEELWTGETVTEEEKVEEEEIKPKKEITTSTIAELYIKQGYIDKAIDIYQTIHDANPYDAEIRKKLDELKKQAEVKIEEEESEVGWAEPTSQEGKVPSNTTLYLSGHESPESRGEKVAEVALEDEKNENIKRLDSWLRTIQNERRQA